MSEHGFTAALARYIADADAATVPAHAVDSVKELVLDTLGVTFAGAREPVAERSRAVVRQLGGAPQSIVVGTPFRTSTVSAALANGTAAHALDLDDSHHPGFLHPSAVLLPAVLALGEERHVDGGSLIVAYLYGLETIVAIGSTINLGHYELGWHATATIGTLAAAAASARLLGLSATETRNALSLAASRAGGVRRNFGSMAKPLHAGLAASDGVLAALLAEEGLTGGESVLEGDRGYFDLVAGAGRWDADAGLAKLDHRFELALEGLGIKRFASCGVTHAPIEAMLQLRERGTTPDDVRAIAVAVHPLARQIANHDEPTGGLAAKFSLPHCLAVALLDGRAGLEQFTDARAADADVAALRARTTVTTDERLGLAGHMSFGCRLELELADGSTLRSEVEIARGKWSGERLTHAELVQKFDECLDAASVRAEYADRCRDLVERLELIPDVGELADGIAAAGAS